MLKFQIHSEVIRDEVKNTATKKEVIQFVLFAIALTALELVVFLTVKW